MTTSTSRLRPLGHRILVKRDNPVEEVDFDNGKFEIVRSRQEQQMAEHNEQTGTLIAIGEDAWKAFRKVNEHGKEVNGQPWAQVGDRVWFSRNCGRVVQHPETEEKFLVMNDEDISIALVSEE